MVKIIKKDKKKKNDENNEKLSPEERVSSEFSKDLKENLDKFKAYLEENNDVVFRKFISKYGNTKCAMVFVDGLVDKDLLELHVISPLITDVQNNGEKQKNISQQEFSDIIIENIISAAEIDESEDLDKAMLKLMSGETILLIDGYDIAIAIGTRQWESRGVQEPVAEAVVRGPREGFSEVLRLNTALIRRRSRDVNTVIKTVSVGRRSKTDVAICYIKGIVQPDLVKEIEKRISKIDVDDINESGDIEQLIEDDHISPFPQIQNTERPDKAVASMMEGRVVIIIDGSPFVLIAPASFYQFFQSPEDYYERWIIGSSLRILRLAGSFIATFLPALYVAIVSYHPGMLPTSLILMAAANRETVPFPGVVEAILMELTIELLREAGARLPKYIGQSIGIVGGIIIGDAAVKAGIASPFMVIIVAITAISSFIIPSYSLAISFRVIRFAIIIMASLLGLYGVILSFIFINIHLVNLKSFGANYMSPLAPIQINDWKDVFGRLPVQLMKRRPEYINPVDIDRYGQDPIKEV